jgi:hypothetical protein
MADIVITLPDLDDLVAEFGGYYVEPASRANLLKKVFYENSTSKFLAQVPTIGTRWRDGIAGIGEVLQRYKDGFQPKGEPTIKPNEIPLYQLKLDNVILPNKYAENYFGFLDSNGLDATQYPIVAYLLGEIFLPQLAEDYELNALYHGIFDDSEAADVAGPAYSSMDGLRIVINRLIDSAVIEPIETGAPDTDDESWCEQVEMFVRSIEKRYSRKPMKLMMNEDLFERYQFGKEKKYNQYYAQDANLASIRHYPNVQVFGSPAMHSSTKLVAWVDDAIVELTKRNNMRNLKVQNSIADPRGLDVYTDFWKAVAPRDPAKVFTNDEDLELEQLLAPTPDPGP